MKAIILAGGKGNRLKPYTDNVPKPLIAIGHEGSSFGKTPILFHIIENLPSYINEVIITTRYLKEMIEEYVEKNYDEICKQNKKITKINIIEQTGPHGTLGALQSAQTCIYEGERFLVLSGDDIHNKEELNYLNFHPRSFGIQKKIMPGYKSVQIDSHGIVTGLEKQTELELAGGCFIATGAYLLDSKIFDFEPVLLTDGEYGLPQTLLKYTDQYPVHAVIETGWIPMNTLEDLQQIRDSYSTPDYAYALQDAPLQSNHLS